MQKHPHGRGEDETKTAAISITAETPPRAWGRPKHGDKAVPPRRKHPHGRGEDSSTLIARKLGPETPPRAWGRPAKRLLGKGFIRNTPTGVGKTASCEAWRRLCRKHPHGRGEDKRGYKIGDEVMETPPRAWGRHSDRDSEVAMLGNTPTGVGKTLGFTGVSGRLASICFAFLVAGRLIFQSRAAGPRFP